MEIGTARATAQLRIHHPLPCAQCGTPLYSPEWSEHIDECRVCHFWICEACDYKFETVVKFPPLQGTG